MALFLSDWVDVISLSLSSDFESVCDKFNRSDFNKIENIELKEEKIKKRVFK